MMKEKHLHIKVAGACMQLLLAGGFLLPSSVALADEDSALEARDTQASDSKASDTQVAQSDDSSETTGSDDNTEVSLPALKVGGTDSTDSYEYGDQSLRGETLSKIPLESREIPQSVSVIDSKRMEQQNLTDLEDVMEEATGVTVQPYQQLTTAYYARGFQIDSFEIDGTPVGIDYQATGPQDMAIYDRVEILRGSNGLLHGSGNPSATVNLVRKKPTKDFRTSLDVSAGSWGTYRGQMDLSGPLVENGRLRGRFVGAYEEEGFAYDEGDQDTGLVYGVIEADLSDDTMLTFGGSHQNTDSVPNMAGIPMASDGSDLDLSQSTFLNTDWSYFDWDSYRAFGSLDHDWGHGWSSKLSLEYAKSSSDLKYGAVYGSSIDAETGDGGLLMGGAYKFEDEHRGVDLHTNGSFKLFGQTHDALVGVAYNKHRHKVETGTFDTSITQSVNVYTWDPSSVAEPSVASYDLTTDSDTTETAAYTMGRFHLMEPVTLVLGSRFSKWEQDTLSTSYDTGVQWVPYAGLIWDFADDWSAYVGYSDVFQPQTSLTYDDSVLDPIEGNSYEVGVKASLLDKRLNVSSALFRIVQSNRAVEDPDHPSTGQTTYYVNGGKVQSQGVELEANGKVNPDWDVSAGYTYTTTKYLEDPDTEGASFSTTTPHHMLKVWSNYTLPWQEKRWSVGTGIKAQSSIRKISNSVTLRQAAYVTADVRVGYRILPSVSASLNVKNISNEKYYQELFSSNWSNRYGEGRSFMLSLRGTF